MLVISHALTWTTWRVLHRESIVHSRTYRLPNQNHHALSIPAPRTNLELKTWCLHLLNVQCYTEQNNRSPGLEDQTGEFLHPNLGPMGKVLEDMAESQLSISKPLSSLSMTSSWSSSSVNSLMRATKWVVSSCLTLARRRWTVIRWISCFRAYMSSWFCILLVCGILSVCQDFLLYST